jgi:voltage-gated potassium channel
MTRNVWRRGAELRHRIYDILEHGSIVDRTGVVVGRLIALLIVVNLAAMTLESVPSLEARYASLFTAIELLSLIVFTIEYGLRVWVAPEHDRHRSSELALGAPAVHLGSLRRD